MFETRNMYHPSQTLLLGNHCLGRSHAMTKWTCVCQVMLYFYKLDTSWGISRQAQALFPHATTMTLLAVVLLSLLLGSVTTTTIKTVLPQKTFELRNDCPFLTLTDRRTNGTIACGLLSLNFIGSDFRFWYHTDRGICAILVPHEYGKEQCWARVPQN